MAQCRICLSKSPVKDLSQLKINKKYDEKSFTEIMMFCLDIQVEQNSKISTKLCLKCYKKIVAFFKFKTLALKNDAYLKSLDVKNEIFLQDDEAIIKADELPLIASAALVKLELEDEISLKAESPANNYCSGSEDEYLSVIKKIKYEYVEDETKENSVNGMCTLDTNEKASTKRRKKYKCKTKIKSVSATKQMCAECGKTVKDLKAHSYLHLPEAERRRIKCRVCDKLFSSHSARYRHNKIKHLGIKEQCPICNKTVTHLRQHNKVMHDKESLQFECMECGRRFICQSSLDLHTRTHTKDRPFICDQCDKTFGSKALLRQHIRCIHEQEKSHLCQLCSRSFFKKYHLHLHLKTHSQERPHECPECGKFYKTAGTLKSHLEIHENVKKHACGLCTQSFVKKEYLLAHMISHNKVKRYPCQYCGLKFHRSDHRKRHEFTAHQKHLLTAASASVSST